MENTNGIHASFSMIPDDIGGTQIVITAISAKDNKIVLYFEKIQ